MTGSIALSHALEAFGDAAISLDPTGIIEACVGPPRVFAVAIAELRGRNVEEVLPAIGADRWRDALRRAAAGEGPQSLECAWATAPTSETYEARVAAVPARGLLAVLRPFHARRSRSMPPASVRPQDEVEQRFQTMADHAPVLLWMAGLDALCDYFNEGWLRFTGRTMEQELGTGWAEGVHAEDLQRCMQTYLEAFVARQPFVMEYRLRRADGEFRWIFDQGAPRFEPDGTFAGFIGSCVDVTDLRHARDALRRSGEQLRGTIEAAPTGMILVDAVGRIVLVNSSVERVFGYPRHDLIGQPVEMLIPERFRGAHAAHRASFVRKPSSRAMAPGRELHGLRRDGSEVPIEIGLRPLRTPDGELVLVSIIDITERKRSEQERELLLAELQRVNADLSTTVGERDLLLQEIHHRVKNNLQVVSSMMNMQQRRLDESDPRRAFDDCRARVEAMASLHEQLFRRGDGDARVPFRDYAHSVAANAYRSSGEADRRVSLQVDVGDLWMHMDQAIPCGLILNELVTNSLRHAFPAGRAGHVRVTVRAVDEGTKEIELTVSDDGVGLPDEVNVDSPASLGLSLVSSFVEQLEGRLDVDRRGGTRTTLRFAQASTERPRERERGSHGSDLDRRG